MKKYIANGIAPEGRIYRQGQQPDIVHHLISPDQLPQDIMQNKGKYIAQCLAADNLKLPRVKI